MFKNITHRKNDVDNGQKLLNSEEINTKINNLSDDLSNIHSEFAKLDSNMKNSALNSKIDELNNNLINISKIINGISDDVNVLSKKVDSLEKKNNQLSNNLNSLKKDHEDILNSYNLYFKTLFIDHDPTPSVFLKNLRTLSLELLTFFNNVCKKYNLQYWLDFGTLLGAVRHKGFIPWDDDLDMGMMRKDFEILKDVLNKEVNNNGLEDIINVNLVRTPRKTVTIAFIQMFYRPENFNKSLASLDIFPYDFVETPNPEMIHNFKKEKHDFHVNLAKGLNNKLAVDEIMENLDLSYSKTDFIIPGVDNARGFRDTYKFAVLKTSTIFPLGVIEYGGKKYPCPNEYDYHLQKIYGDYWQMPKLIRQHDYILDYLRKYPNINDHYEKHILKLREINKKFS